MAVEATSPRELELERKQKEADIENAKRVLEDGKTPKVGVRIRVGQTRGKNPVIITWEAFDESLPESLPTGIQMFLDTVGLTPAKDEALITSFLIGGYNDAMYTAASDPLAEFVDLTWPADAQTQFRLVVRNYSRGAGVSLEDAVALIKPGFAKQFEKK